LPVYPREFEREPALREELTPEQMLRIIFDYTAKIANERNLHNVRQCQASVGSYLRSWNADP